MNSPTGGATAQPEKIVVTDPHIEDTGLSESEVTRIRTLQGVWRWALIAFTLATILLCMNQQFAWRFFIGYTQLNTEYFYLLIALMLPFTFLIFPGWSKAPLDRIPWYDAALFFIAFGASIYLMTYIRAAASNGWEFGGAPTRRLRRRPDHVGAADGGAAPRRRLEPAAQRLSVHRLSRCLPTRNGSGRSAARSPTWTSSPPTTCCPAKACSASRCRPLPTR